MADSEYTPRVIDASIHLTPLQERVLGYIAAQDVAGRAACYSKRELSHALRCSVKTIDRAITLLRREGIIQVEEHFAEDGAQMPNAYHLAR